METSINFIDEIVFIFNYDVKSFFSFVDKLLNFLGRIGFISDRVDSIV